MADSDVSAASHQRSRGCLAIIAVMVTIAIAAPFGVSYLREQSRLRLEHQMAEWRKEKFTDVKNGASSVRVGDPLLLPMLANDADCVANLKDVFFSMVTIKDEDAKHMARLTNVVSLGFYDTEGAEHALENATNLPIESLYFEGTPLPEGYLHNLSIYPNLKRVHIEFGVTLEETVALQKLLPDATVKTPYTSN